MLQELLCMFLYCAAGGKLSIAAANVLYKYVGIVTRFST